MLHVFHLMGFSKIFLTEVDFSRKLNSFFWASLDVCLQFGHFDISLIDHVSCFNDSAVDCVTFMLEVFITALITFNVLFKHLDLTILLLKLVLVVKSHGSETVFEEVASLLNICDFYSKGFKVSIKPRIISNLLAISSNDRVVDQ